jgi:hypothetical protein
MSRAIGGDVVSRSASHGSPLAMAPHQLWIPGSGWEPGIPRVRLDLTTRAGLPVWEPLIAFMTLVSMTLESAITESSASHDSTRNSRQRDSTRNFLPAAIPRPGLVGSAADTVCRDAESATASNASWCRRRAAGGTCSCRSGHRSRACAPPDRAVRTCARALQLCRSASHPDAPEEIYGADWRTAILSGPSTRRHTGLSSRRIRIARGKQRRCHGHGRESQSASAQTRWAR